MQRFFTFFALFSLALTTLSTAGSAGGPGSCAWYQMGCTEERVLEQHATVQDLQTGEYCKFRVTAFGQELSFVSDGRSARERTAFKKCLTLRSGESVKIIRVIVKQVNAWGQPEHTRYKWLLGTAIGYLH